MSWRPHGRAEVDSAAPRAFATCDRCGFLTNLYKLQYQYQWAGTDLINLGIKVCSRCLDVPSEFLRTIIIPPDPPPVNDPRPEPYVLDEIDYRETEDDSTRITEEDSDRVTGSTASQDYSAEDE